MKIGVKKFGVRESDEIPLHTYAEAGRLDGFSIHAGDEGVSSEERARPGHWNRIQRACTLIPVNFLARIKKMN